MISKIYKANEIGLNIYAYLYLEKIFNNDSDISILINNVKLITNGKDIKSIIIEPLIIESFITISEDKAVNITPKGKAVFVNSNDIYLQVMKHYPLTLYFSGNNFPAKVSDKRCIEVLSSLDLSTITLDDIIKSIEYAKKNDLITMKFDKYIESKYYEAILEKMKNNVPINMGIFGKTFDYD